MGGLAIVQDPAEAEYDGMPHSAIDTKRVDFILPVAEMPAKISAFRRVAARIVLPADSSAIASSDGLKADALHEVLT